MATIGTVTKHDDGHYEGELRTLSVRADIAIMPVSDKAAPAPPLLSSEPHAVRTRAPETARAPSAVARSRCLR